MTNKALRTYETVIAFNPELTEDKLGELNRKVIEIINAHQGIAGPVRVWGKFRLAYRIKKADHAYYSHVIYTGNGDTIVELERNLKIWSEALRYLTTNILDKTSTAEELAKLVQEANVPAPEDIIASEFDELSEVGVYTTGRPVGRAGRRSEEGEEEWSEDADEGDEE